MAAVKQNLKWFFRFLGSDLPDLTKFERAGIPSILGREAEGGNHNLSPRMCSRAFIHSNNKSVVEREIALIENSVRHSTEHLPHHEQLYLLSLGYYKIGDYAKSWRLLKQCLELAPDYSEALSFSRKFQYEILLYGANGIFITALAAGIAVGSLAATLARRK